MKTIYLTTESLYGNIDSGSLRCSYSNYKMLVETFGSDLYHIYLGDKNQKVDRSITEYKRMEDKRDKVWLSLLGRRFLSPKQEKRIEQEIIKKAPDCVFYEGPYWAFIVDKLKKKLPGTLFVMFMHNIEKDYYKNLYKKSVSQKILYYITCKNEKISVKTADKIICLNYRDAQRLEQIYHRESNCLLPINMEDVCNVKKMNNSENNKTLLFVGSFFPPNYDGIKWFINHVMKKMEDYKLVIVGRGFENVKDELETKNVKVIGSVKELSAYYYSYPVIVMPILYGAGMKVKTAEALMYGKTIIATKEALEGYPVADCSGIYECNSEDEFVNAITEVFSNDRYLSIQEDVRKLFLENFETKNLSKSFQIQMTAWLSEAGGVDCEK